MTLKLTIRIKPTKHEQASTLQSDVNLFNKFALFIGIRFFDHSYSFKVPFISSRESKGLKTGYLTYKQNLLSVDFQA